MPYMKIKLAEISKFTLAYLLLVNGPILYADFLTYKSVPFFAILEILKNSIYIFIGAFALIYGLSLTKSLFIAGTFLLFLSSSFGIYYISEFGIQITPEIINIIAYNEPEDAFELVGVRVILWMIFVGLIWYYLVKRYASLCENGEEKSITHKISASLLLIFSLYFMAWPEFKLYKHFLPWQATNSFALFIQKSPEATKTDISSLYQFELADNEQDKNIILVIGESAKYNHFSLNGYERETNPELKTIPNLFSFYANSCASMTYLSVSCMLSRYGKEEFDVHKNETSIISIFNKLGFDTAWFGTQNIGKYFEARAAGSFYKEPKLLLIPGGSALYAMNDHDEVMLPFIDDYLKKKGNKFVVIHTIGSHWDYANRYPKEFEKFRPVCNGKLMGKKDPRDCNQEELKNIYDNSILYTDYFLSRVIDLLKAKNSLLIYVSDHAVSLGEGGRYGQGGNAPEQFEIPFIVWGSDIFLEKHQNFKDFMASSKNLKISHDYVFHSLLGCAGVKSDLIKPSLNLCKN